jgi:hypothetical protein
MRMGKTPGAGYKGQDGPKARRAPQHESGSFLVGRGDNIGVV